MPGILVLALAAWLPTGPAHPPGQLSALLSLPRRLHALTLIDKNLILPPWPYKAWFPSPESLAGPLTFLISCSCLLLWCCFGRGQGGHGEWKHLAGQTLLPACCPCRRWPLPARVTCGLLPRVVWLWVQLWAESAFLLEGPVLSLHSLALSQSRVPYPCCFLCRLLLRSRCLEMGGRGVCSARLG